MATPKVGVLILSQFLEDRYAIDLLGDEPDGVGYLLKDRVANVGMLADAVRRVARGGSVDRPRGRPAARRPSAQARPGRRADPTRARGSHPDGRGQVKSGDRRDAGRHGVGGGAPRHEDLRQARPRRRRARTTGACSPCCDTCGADHAADGLSRGASCPRPRPRASARAARRSSASIVIVAPSRISPAISARPILRLDLALDEAPQRPGAVHGVVALAGDQGARRLGQLRVAAGGRRGAPARRRSAGRRSARSRSASAA